MRVSSQKVENCQVELEVEAGPEEMEESLERAYHRLVGRVVVPGFRRGKAPRPILERYIGRKALVDEAVELLLPEIYSRALEQEGIKTIDAPRIEILQAEPLTFKAIASLPPMVELGDYHQLRLAPQPMEVTEGDVDKLVEAFQHRQATWEPVNRPVKMGDMVAIDVVGTAEGEQVVNNQGTWFTVIEGGSLAGFAPQLVGMSAGENKEFKLALPADFSRQEAAGKECSFKVLIHEVKEERLPSLDDDFARSLGEDSLDALRQKLGEQLRVVKEAEARRLFEEQVLQAVMDASTLEFPPVMVERELEGILRDTGWRGEKVMEEVRPLAHKRVARGLLLVEVVKAENIQVTQEEIAKAMGENSEENKSSREEVESRLLARKAIERLVEIATSPEPAAEETVQSTGGENEA